MSQLSYKTLFIILLFLLIPVVFLLRINQKPTNTLAAWWNDSWTYRQSINISSHSSAESNVYLTTTINIGTTNKSQIDNGDFRFLNQSGQLLDYYISSGAGTTAPVFHIQIPSFPGGAQTIYAYYGNPSISNGFSVSDFSTAASNYTIGSLGSEEIGGGPIAHWKFDEGIGTTAYDSSGHQYNGIFGPGSSAPTWTDASQCISGKCLDFQKSKSNHLSFTNNQMISGNSNFTISYWAKFRSISSNGNLVICVGGQNTNTSSCTGIFNGQIGSNFYGGAGLISTTTIILNKWYYITSVIEQSGISVYVDGNYQGKGSPVSYNISGSNANIIGNFSIYNTNWGFDGFLDDVKIFPYARTASQILQDYNTGKSGQSSSDSTNTSFGSSSQKSLSDGLVGYWKFDEGIGTSALDSSGNSITGTLLNTGWTSGKIGVGASLDGTGDYINLGQNYNFTSENFSISYWIKLNSLTTNENGQGPVPFYKGSYLTNGYYSQIGTSGYVRFMTNQSGTIQSTSTPNNTISVGSWYHLTYVRNGFSVRIYVNGEDKTSSTGNHINPASSTSNFQIGKYYSGNIDTNGIIDEFRVYNRALSADEVSQLYNYSPTPSSRSPLVWYKLDNSVGNTIPNSGSLGNQADGISTTATLQFLDGKINKSLRFTGSNYVNIGISIPSQAYTKSLWVKYASGGTNYNILSGSTGHVLFASNGTGNKLSSGHNGSWASVQDPVALDTNWHHVAVTYDSQNNGSLKLYKDARLVSSAVGISPPSGDTGFYLGAWSGGNTWVGQIDEAKIYNYALSADEIKNDYNQSSSAVFGVTNLTVGNTSTLANYCVPGSTDPCAPPVGEWKFEEGNGTTAFDTSGNGNHAGFGTGASAPTWASGKIGKSLNFNGFSYANAGKNTSLNVTNITVEAWVKPSSFIGDSDQSTIATKSDSYYLQVGTDGKLRVYQYGVTPAGYHSSSKALTLNTWQHVAYTYDGSQIKMYIDGVGDTIIPATGNITTSSYCLGLGANLTTSCTLNLSNLRRFKGLIDQVSIYNYARTPAQIALDYNQGAPIAHFKFDECQGNVSHSSTGIGTTGTISIGSGGSQSSLGTCTTSGAWFNGATGKLNSSLSFDGTDDYIDLGIKPVWDLTTFSISGWFKTSDKSNYKVITSKNSGSSNNRNWWITIWQAGAGYHPDGSLVFRTSSGGAANVDIDSGIDVANNQWHHFVATLNSTSANLYIDGTLKSSFANPGIPNTPSTAVIIGNDPVISGRFFNGLIDDVQIYNYALTPEQIKQLYNGGAINFN